MMDHMSYRPVQVLKQVGQSLARDFSTGRCVDNASILTLTTLLSIVPLITLIYSALQFMPGMTETGKEIETWIFEQFMPSRSNEIQQALSQFSTQTSKLTIVGTAVLLVTSLLMLARVEKCLNAIWQVKTPSASISSFLRYWAVLSLGPIFIGLGVVLTSYVTSMRVVGSAVELLGVQGYLLSLSPFLSSVCGFTLVYTAVPNCDVPLKAALLGAVAAALLFEVSKKLFALFITLSPSYELIYGALAALPIFIVWVNLSWTIILGGSVVSRTFATDVMRVQQMPDFGATIEILGLFSDAQTRGDALTTPQVLERLPWLTRFQWDRIRELFERNKILTLTSKDRFVMQRSPHAIDKKELLHMMGWLPSLDALPAEPTVSPQAIQLARPVYDMLQQLQRRIDETALAGSIADWLQKSESNKPSLATDQAYTP